MNGKKRGFGAMDASKQKSIASRGGRAAHEQGVAHEFSADEARIAGKKGGETISRDRSHMAKIGQRGGHARAAAIARRFDQGAREEVEGQPDGVTTEVA